jgi:hypothetical protein
MLTATVGAMGKTPARIMARVTRLKAGRYRIVA